MRTLFLLAMLALTGCTTAQVTKHWHVNPADMQRFKDDSLKCERFAIGSPYFERLFDDCLQNSGYRLELVTE